MSAQRRAATRVERAGPVATLLTVAAMALATPMLSGCIPAVIVAGAGATTLVATDRRTAGAQVEVRRQPGVVLASALVVGAHRHAERTVVAPM